MAVDPHNTEAVARLFAQKKRAREKPLALLASNLSQIIPFLREKIPTLPLLAENFWPGKLTIVLPIDLETIPPIVRARRDCVGFRVPKRRDLRQLLFLTGPLAVTSANLSGSPPLFKRKELEKTFPFPLFSSDFFGTGTPSTVIAYREGNWSLLREGEISFSFLRKFLREAI